MNSKLDTKGIMPLWLSGQTDLPKVVRWRQYVAANPKLRAQSTLEHTWALTFLGGVIVNQIRGSIEFNEGLVLQALNIHDVSKGILKRDELYRDKSPDKDCAEYLAFMKYIEDMDERSRIELQRAFLLQFAENNPLCFPPEARRVMTLLQEYEVKAMFIFSTIEIVDYLLYPIECYDGHGDEVPLAHVLRNQLARLETIVTKLPQLKDSSIISEILAFGPKAIIELAHVPAEEKPSLVPTPIPVMSPCALN